MTKFIKKPLSILLAALMIVSLFAMVPVTASADVGDYVAEENYLTFTAVEAGASVTLNVSSGSNLQYSLDGGELIPYTPGTPIGLVKGDSVSFRGNNTTFDNSNHVSIDGKVACSGNVMSLRLDDGGMSQGLSDSCFYRMFSGCAGLTAAPKLPETMLESNCYNFMFYGCTSLTTAPELPATALAKYCYYGMFYDCTSLTTAPELPATTLARGCYNNMFDGCGRLTTAPKLPATELAENCYSGMFEGCTRLTTAPELPATTLVRNCYNRMFVGCSSIKLSETETPEYSIPYRVPSGGDGTTATYALYNMFYGTGGTFAGTPAINTIYYLYREVPKYTVTWKNGDTTLETDTDVAEGATPTYNGETPEKASDKYYDYTFSGWSDGTNTYAADALPAVSGDVTYTAQFTATAKTFKAYVKTLTGGNYTINNLTGGTTVAQLKEIIADQTDIPVAAQRLIFAGKQIDDAKTLAEYNIGEESTIHLIIRSYTVTWLNYDNSELGTANVAAGTTPSYGGETPEKAEDENNTYTFSGWTDGTNTYGATDTLPAVTGNITYKATFEETPKTPEPAPGNFVKVVSRPTDWSGDYLIVNESTMSAFDGGLTALNSDDNKVSISDDYVPGNIPTFKSSATTYAARFTIAAVDGGYSIKSASGKFIGNTANSSNMQTSDTALVNTITWNSGKVHVTASGGPELYYDYQNNRFSYYTNDSMFFDSVKLYKFVPSEPVTTYTVTWKNGDTVLKTDTVEEGNAPAYTGNVPEKAEDENNTYTFSGWTDGTNTYGATDTLPAVTGDVTYTAQFTATEKAPATVKTIAAGETYYIGDSIAFSDAPPFVYVRYDDDTSYGPNGAYAYLIGGENTTVTAPTYSTRDGQWKFNDVLRYEPWASARPLRITGTNERTPIGFKCSGGTGTSSDPFTFECVFEAEEETGINYGDDNYIKQDDKVTVSDSDEGKTKFGLNLNEYFNMQMLGIQKKSAIATEGDEDGIRFVTAVNTNLLKGNKIKDYGYIVVKANEGTSIEDIYAKMDRLTYEQVDDKNRFRCTGTSNTISGDFGKFDTDTDYKYVTLSLTGTKGSTDTVAARFYVQTTDGEYHYAKYVKGNDTHSGMAFKLSDVIDNLG